MSRRRPGGCARPGGAAAAGLVAAALLAAALLGGCGTAAPSGGGPAPWRSTHPDPGGGVRFLDASGVCVISVRYPDDAPGEIVVDMTTFVQHDRSPRPPAPPAGRVVATSADWSVVVVGGELRLLTPDSVFDYRAAQC